VEEVLEPLTEGPVLAVQRRGARLSVEADPDRDDGRALPLRDPAEPVWGPQPRRRGPGRYTRKHGMARLGAPTSRLMPAAEAIRASPRGANSPFFVGWVG
jgi:hypothetical protein